MHFDTATAILLKGLGCSNDDAQSRASAALLEVPDEFMKLISTKHYIECPKGVKSLRGPYKDAGFVMGGRLKNLHDWAVFPDWLRQLYDVAVFADFPDITQEYINEVCQHFEDHSFKDEPATAPKEDRGEDGEVQEVACPWSLTDIYLKHMETIKMLQAFRKAEKATTAQKRKRETLEGDLDTMEHALKEGRAELDSIESAKKKSREELDQLEDEYKTKATVLDEVIDQCERLSNKMTELPITQVLAQFKEMQTKLVAK